MSTQNRRKAKTEQLTSRFSGSFHIFAMETNLYLDDQIRNLSIIQILLLMPQTSSFLYVPTYVSLSLLLLLLEFSSHLI